MIPDQIAGIGTLLTWLGDAGPLGVTLWFVWMLKSGELVWKRELDKAELREAEWRRLALRGTDELVIPMAREMRKQVREGPPKRASEPR